MSCRIKPKYDIVCDDCDKVILTTQDPSEAEKWCNMSYLFCDDCLQKRMDDWSEWAIDI